MVSDERKHPREASLTVSWRLDSRNPLKTPPVLQVSSWSLGGRGENIQEKLLWQFLEDWILKLVRMIMTKNVFTFNEETWLQLLGCCMGSRVSPSCANLFMSVLEKKILQDCPQNLKQYLFLWKHFIDDILCVWRGTWDQFSYPKTINQNSLIYSFKRLEIFLGIIMLKDENLLWSKNKNKRILIE